MSSRALAAICGAALIAACGAPSERLVEHHLFAMSTSVDVIISTAAPANAREAVDAIEQMLRQFERDYYAWGDGELGALNAALQAGDSFEASAEMTDLLSEARHLSARSAGCFDPGVGRLVEAWGFHSATGGDGPPPDAARIAELLESSAGIDALEIDGRRVSATTTHILLDLGGIAKGYAVDRMLAMLAASGMTDAMVNAGGDVRAAGSAGERAWRVGIQSPRAADLLGALELADGEAVFTSGDYERYYETEQGRVHHLLDPTTGMPATHTQAVTVIAGDGVTADAAATALFVAGPSRWLDIARRLGIEYALRVDASGRVEATEPMRDRLQTGSGTASDILFLPL